MPASSIIDLAEAALAAVQDAEAATDDGLPDAAAYRRRAADAVHAYIGAASAAQAALDRHPEVMERLARGADYLSAAVLGPVNDELERDLARATVVDAGKRIH